MQFPAVFALGFAAMWMLPWLGAASLPIIIHLLNKRKFRETQWAAMRFLLAAIRKNYRRIRIEQWLLLAIRTLLVLLVVLAMMKPYLESVGAIPVLAGRRTHRVIVLDGSMSMDYTTAEASRFEQAKRVAEQLVRGARRGDAVSLILMADPPRVVIGDPSPNPEAVLKELADVTLTHGTTNVRRSLERVIEVLDVSEIPQKEVVFVTDLQAASWRRPGESGDDGLKRALAALDQRKARSYVIDLGKQGAENRAVVDLRIDPPVVTLNSTTTVTAVLRNFGRTPATGVRVRLIVDGQIADERDVDLPAGEEASLSFSPSFTTSGDHLIEARIDSDPLKIDDRRFLAVPVRETLNVLLVDGDQKAEPFASESGYLSQALSPSDSSSGGPPTPSIIRTEVASESQISRRDLAPYDAVVLCNIAQVAQAETAALVAYLKQGGGVVVFGGDQVTPENYNRLLFNDGNGLLPAEVGAAVGDARTKPRPIEFNPLGYAHPIISAFNNAPDAVQAGLTSVKTWQYQKLKLPKGSTARVALAFDTGDPAVIEADRYRGKVFQIATTADAAWTTWPLHPSFPPVMEQLILQAASGKQAERNVLVGRPLDQSMPPAGADSNATIDAPGDRAFQSALKLDGDVSQLHFENTQLSGPYKVKLGPPLAMETTFAVNTDPVESDMTKLDEAGLKDALPGWSFVYLNDTRGAMPNVSSVGSKGELHRSLLYMVLALLIVESIVAWKFGHHGPRT